MVRCYNDIGLYSSDGARVLLSFHISKALFDWLIFLSLERV